MLLIDHSATFKTSYSKCPNRYGFNFTSGTSPSAPKIMQTIELPQATDNFLEMH